VNESRIADAGNGSEIRDRVFRFACDVVALHDSVVARASSGRDMSRQLLRAATSIGANLEEADAAQSRPDFVSKCTISLKEAREAHYWLRLLRATGKIDDAYDRLVHEADRIVAVLTTIVRKTKGDG
jgi:four helix bundle protein